MLGQYNDRMSHKIFWSPPWSHFTAEWWQKPVNLSVFTCPVTLHYHQLAKVWARADKVHTTHFPGVLSYSDWRLAGQCIISSRVTSSPSWEEPHWEWFIWNRNYEQSRQRREQSRQHSQIFFVEYKYRIWSNFIQSNLQAWDTLSDIALVWYVVQVCNIHLQVHRTVFLQVLTPQRMQTWFFQDTAFNL